MRSIWPGWRPFAVGAGGGAAGSFVIFVVRGWLWTDVSAEWAQAIGTTIAIFAATWIGQSQVLTQRALERERRLSEQRKVVASAVGVAEVCFTQLNRVYIQARSDGDVSDFSEFASSLEMANAQVRAFPLASLPDGAAMIILVGIIGLTDKGARLCREMDKFDPSKALQRAPAHFVKEMKGLCDQADENGAELRRLLAPSLD